MASASPRFGAKHLRGGRGFFNAVEKQQPFDPAVLKPWRIERSSGTPKKDRGPTCTWTCSGFEEFWTSSAKEYASLESLGFLTKAGLHALRVKGIRDTHDLLARLVSRTERSLGSVEAWIAALGPASEELRREVAEGLWRRMMTVYELDD